MSEPAQEAPLHPDDRDMMEDGGARDRRHGPHPDTEAAVELPTMLSKLYPDVYRELQNGGAVWRCTHTEIEGQGHRVMCAAGNLAVDRECRTCGKPKPEDAIPCEHGEQRRAIVNKYREQKGLPPLGPYTQPR